MQFAIGVTVLECSFVKHSHGPLGVNHLINKCFGDDATKLEFHVVAFNELIFVSLCICV
jgi:hypothetical protein